MDFATKFWPKIEVLLSCVFCFRTSVCFDEERFRSAGPDRIIPNSQMSPHFRSLTADSVLSCYLTCFNTDAGCAALSYQASTSLCNLVRHDVSVAADSDYGWVSITLLHQSAGSEVADGMDWTRLPATPECTANFTFLLDKCYFISESKQLTVYSSTLACNDLDANLLSIETEEELLVVENLMMDTGTDWHIWTSGRGRGTGTNSYIWAATQEEVTFTNWSFTAPGGNFLATSCIYLDGFLFAWEITDCSQTNRYICEKAAP